VEFAGRHILFVQHAGALGGSVVSLRYLIEGLVKRSQVVSVAMVEPNADVRSLYERSGATVHDLPRIPLFRHTTAGWAHLGNPRACAYQLSALRRANVGHADLERLIDRVKPDVVHLNSVTLALTARALARSGPPFVWHVRESPVSGYAGFRREFLRRTLMECGDEVIFLSASDQRDWVQGRRGEVVPNVVPLQQPPTTAAIERERERYGLRPGDRAVAYAGGLAEIKGIFPLIEAVNRLVPRFPTLRILAPGAVLPAPRSFKARLARQVLPMLGMAREFERAQQLLEDPGLRDTFRTSGFVHDILPVIAAAEFLVFPATVPHFARPVVEAASVGRASIGSDHAGVSDVIKDDVTGRLVPAGDSRALAAAMEELLTQPAVAAEMGRAALELARERFDAGRQISHVLAIYQRVLQGRSTPGLSPRASGSLGAGPA
jgi:glycosyltransferase involved in cell wall biosynthesis